MMLDIYISYRKKKNTMLNHKEQPCEQVDFMIFEQLTLVFSLLAVLGSIFIECIFLLSSAV